MNISILENAVRILFTFKIYLKNSINYRNNIEGLCNHKCLMLIFLLIY
jgi:hypothetical protein